MQYKIKNHHGTYKEPVEIQRIIKQELGGESLEWTIGKAYLASKPSVRPFIILLGNDLLTCKALRASNAYSSTHLSQQLSQKLRSQKVACVLVCWHNTAINSTPFHYHSLPMLVHLYGIVLSLLLLNFQLMSSVQLGTWRTPRIHHWSLEQRSLYSWGLSSCVLALCGSPGASDQGISTDVRAFIEKHLQPLHVSTFCAVAVAR